MEKFLGCLGAVCLTVLVFLLYGAIVFWLWEFVAVAALGLPALTYWQAYGLVVLTNILFNGSTTKNYYYDWRKH